MSGYNTSKRTVYTYSAPRDNEQSDGIFVESERGTMDKGAVYLEFLRVTLEVKMESTVLALEKVVMEEHGKGTWALKM